MKKVSNEKFKSTSRLQALMDDGSSLKGSYVRLHKTFANLWPSSWSQVSERDSGPLRYEFGPENAY